MATRRATITDRFTANQEQRTISGARNVAITSNRSRRTNNKEPQPRDVRRFAKPENLVLLKNKELRSLVFFMEKEDRSKREVVDFLEDTFDSFEELESLLEQYQQMLDEKTRGLIGKALLIWKYIKVTRLNFWIIAWAIPHYIFQLKFNLLQLTALGLMAVVDKAVGYITNDNGSYVLEAFNKVFNFFWQGIAYAASKIIGVNLPPDLNIEALAGFVLLIPWLTGILMLPIMLFLYEFTLTSSLHGKAAGAKMGWFCFAIFGYFVPILNLFPWFVPWMILVWRYPK